MTNYVKSLSGKNFGGDAFNSYYYMLPSAITLSTGELAARSTVLISLDNILPDDGYDYKIFLGADGNMEYSGQRAHFWVYPGTFTDSVPEETVPFATEFFQEYARTSALYHNSASRWIHIKSTDRNITLVNTGGARYAYTLYYYGLRRLANNVTQNCISKIDVGKGIYIPDGETWTEAVQNADLGTNRWVFLAYDGTKFVALGVQGHISTSTDGITWTTAIQNTNLGENYWQALTYDGTKFVALSSTGYLSTSVDGTNWTTAIQNSDLGSNGWVFLAYDGTKFVALSSLGHISTSTDGITWATAIQNTNLGNHNWSRLAYDGTKFVALSLLGHISTSTDGTTWTTAVQDTNLGNHNWSALAYDGTKFVALGFTGHISTSTDGETWTTATQNTDLGENNWRTLAYNNTRFVALGTTGYISTSPNIPTSNKIQIGGDNFDGQPVQKYLSLFEGTMDVNDKEVLSLAGYLPNDNYDYLVDFEAFGRTATSSSGYYHWYITSGNKSPLVAATINTNLYYNLMATEYHSTSSYICANNISIPLLNGKRTITFAVIGGTKTSGACGISALGYRRIGNNMKNYGYIPSEYILDDSGDDYPMCIKYEDMLKIGKITEAGKYHVDLYKMSANNEPVLYDNVILIVYETPRDAQEAVENWQNNPDFRSNAYTLITDLDDLEGILPYNRVRNFEVALDYRQANISFTQEGLFKFGNETYGNNPQIKEIGELS